jgi:hypothetical protein
MPVDQMPTRPAAPRGDAKLVKYDEFIDRQVESTRRVVKLVDFATSLVVLAAGVLTFLLVAAAVEHWLRPGGFSVVERVILFALLAGSVVYFAVRRLLPLILRRVNPVYAAHAIETSADGASSLKNSLVNLLLFRQKRSEIPDAVYHTLEEQAAQRLSRVPLDSAVDQSLLIRFGYVLVAIVAVAALYKVFSPKDPVIAVQRVLMPWADIVPASRVNISEIKPGGTTISRGEFLDVSAEVRGIDDDDTVSLKFTTADGRAIDRVVPMKLSADQLRYEVRLPNEPSSKGSAGLAQSFTYRIEAGDARTLDYRIHVIEAPSILVERIEYDYPEYTGFVDRAEMKLHDIRAIEGTRITIHARANGPIKDAHVDFDADGRRDLTMKSGDSEAMDASASFILSLRDDRRTPTHASYVLRFTNGESRSNKNPVKHSIAVEPDYAPEPSIIAPKDKTLDIRIDETVTIEVAATDPDFALADVRLRGQAAGRDVLEQPLLKQNHKGRFTARYQFTPGKHDLKAGDVVDYWLAAKDNRAPNANVAESTKQRFRIVSPNPNQQPPPDRIAQRDPRQNQPGKGQQEQEEQRGGEEQRQGEGETGRQGDSNAAQQGEAGTNQPNDNQQGGRDGERSADPGSEQQPGENSPDQNQQQPGAQQPGAQHPGNNAEQQPGGQSQQSGGKSQQSEQDPNNKQTGAGASGGESSKSSSPDGTRPDGNTGSQPNPNQQPSGRDGKQSAQSGNPQNGQRQRGQQQDGQQRPSENVEPSPVSAAGDNDGEAFERIQQHMKRNEEKQRGGEGETRRQGDKKSAEQQQDAANQKDNKQEPVSRDAQRSAQEQRGGEGETRRQGDSKATPDDATSQKNDAERSADEQDANKSDSETKDSNQLSDSKQQPNPEEQQTKPGNQETSTKGASGAGDEQKSQGAPEQQPGTKQPTEKPEQAPSGRDDPAGEDPQAGARGESKPESHGDEGADLNEPSVERGSPKSPHEGTGSHGQNQSADEGVGQSAEKGAGNNSQNAGSDATADRKTGQSSGETKGRGSKTRPGEEPGAGEEQTESEQQRGGEGEKGRHGESDSAQQEQEQGASKNQDGNQQDGKQQPVSRDAERSTSNDPNGAKPGEQKSNQTGAPTGDGGVQGSDATPAPATGSAPEGDDANLEYARQQTDLVLDKLSEQLKRKKVDENLLKQLGWSEDELQKFVDRWQERKSAAQKNDPNGDAAKRELDDALRSLGLKPGTMKQAHVKDDRLRDLREGYRGPVPAEYQERLRAYNRGVSRSTSDSEE